MYSKNMHHKKAHIQRFSALLAAAALGLALFGCASGGARQTAGNTPPATESGPAAGGESSNSNARFKLRAVSPVGSNEIVVADELGFFADEGIEIEFIGALGQGVTEFQLIEQGEIDCFVTSHPPQVANARLAGMDPIIVGPGMVDSEAFPHVRYLVRNDSPIQSLDDAVGRKVAISNSSPCTDGYVKYYLASRGLDSDNVEFVLLASGVQEQSLLQGLVDISTSHPPFGEHTLATGEAREIVNTWDIFHSPGAGLSCRGFSEKFIREHPDVVQGFVNAMYRSRVWINNNLEESLEIIADYLDLASSDLGSFYYDENKNVDPSYIESWFEIAEDIDMWKKGDILPEDIYTNAFVPADIPPGDAALHWTR